MYTCVCVSTFACVCVFFYLCLNIKYSFIYTLHTEHMCMHVCVTQI